MSVETSNRLTDLAERIRQAQDRAKEASVEAAEQSLEAGRLLIEAKAECRHGDWLPFLEKAGVHERQARRLMQLARSGLKADTVSDLGGVKAALEHLAEQAQPETDPWEWAKQQLTGPFDGWDITEDNRNWLVSKFTYHANVPVVVAFGLDTYGEYKLATLRMASTVDLAQSIYALAPYAKGDAEVDFKSLTPHHMMKLAISISLAAKHLIAVIWTEMEYREGKDDARLEREAQSINAQLMAEVDKRMAALEPVA